MAGKMRNSNVDFLISNSREEVYGYTGCAPTGNTLGSSGILASVGIEHRLGFLTFFWLLPSVKAYRRTLKAIEKLRITEYEFTNEPTRLLKGKASIKKEDNGFDDLVNLLIKNKWLGNTEVDELIVREQKLAAGFPFNNAKFQWLNMRQGKKEEAIMFPLGIARSPLHEITDLAEKNVRRDIANASGLLILLWLLISTFMICLNLSQ